MKNLAGTRDARSTPGRTLHVVVESPSFARADAAAWRVQVADGQSANVPGRVAGIMLTEET